MNSAGRPRFTTFYHPEGLDLVAKILYCSVACPFCVLLFRLSCLLDTIARVSICNLIQMIICLIKEGSDWPCYNLIIKSKGKGLRFISINCLIAINFQLTPLILNYSLSRESPTRSNYHLLILLQLFLLREPTTRFASNNCSLL